MDACQTIFHNARIIEDATVVFVYLTNGTYRCHKARDTGVIRGGLYTHNFVISYAKRVPNAIIIEEGQVNA